MRVESLPAALSSSTNVLILGSMPGVRSLADGQYYAHPRNSFWQIMERLLGVSSTLPYRDRVEALNEAGVGVWDVLKHCVREGSLDSRIAEETEVPNDIPGLLREFPSVNMIAFNGQKAEKSFRRHFAQPHAGFDGIEFVSLPSTSPAHASMSLELKTAAWGRILDVLKRSAEHGTTSR